MSYGNTQARPGPERRRVPNTKSGARSGSDGTDVLRAPKGQTNRISDSYPGPSKEGPPMNRGGREPKSPPRGWERVSGNAYPAADGNQRPGGGRTIRNVSAPSMPSGPAKPSGKAGRGGGD